MLALRGRPHYNTDWIVERLSGADPIARLILAASKMSQLFLATTSLQHLLPISTPLDSDTVSQLTFLLLLGRQIDLELTSWSQDLPDRWLPLVIYPDKSDSNDFLITYHHLSIASVWTYYRAVRIVSHVIMLGLRKALAAATGEVPEDTGTEVPAVVQKMITDICRSIPFCLGDVDMLGNRTASASPSAESKPQPRARAFSVYSMVWPLWYILSCGLATPEQEQQIRSCLSRVGSVLGIKLALVLAEDASSQKRSSICVSGSLFGAQ